MTAASPWAGIASRMRRMAIKLGFDAALAFLSVWIAFLLQYQLDIPSVSLITEHALTFSALYITVSTALGLHRAIWRYTSISDLLRLAEATAITLGIFIIYQFIFRRELFAIPSLMLIHAMVFGGMICGQRLLHRALHEGLIGRPLSIDSGTVKTRILVVGAGDAVDRFVKANAHNITSPYEIVGIVDARRTRAVGETLHGVCILGNLARLEAVLSDLTTAGAAPQRLVFASVADMQVLPPERLSELSERFGFRLSRLPDARVIDDSLDAPRAQLKPIAIEDLLGRPQAHVDLHALSTLIAGQRVLVTGGGGSIGSELCRQIASFAPAELTVLDSCEYNLYRVDLDLAPLAADKHFVLRSLLCDVRDAAQIDRLFAQQQPQIVFHAAALKHVPLVELNPAQGIRTNIVGTRNVALAAQKHGARAFVQISTDKAVNPTNVMGATKRLGEYYAQALDLTGGATRFVTVRFGNVLGSSGSVVPLFRRQLEAGGPLTVTHPDIKRFFMTVQEAVALVLQASATALSDDGTRGLVHVLDMGKPIKIVDVARQMIRLADLRPDVDVRIEIIGLRPGEKLFEELFDDREQRTSTADPAILAATTAALPLQQLDAAISNLKIAAESDDAPAIRTILGTIVPGYTPEN